MNEEKEEKKRKDGRREWRRRKRRSKKRKSRGEQGGRGRIEGGKKKKRREGKVGEKGGGGGEEKEEQQVEEVQGLGAPCWIVQPVESFPAASSPQTDAGSGFLQKWERLQLEDGDETQRSDVTELWEGGGAAAGTTPGGREGAKRRETKRVFNQIRLEVQPIGGRRSHKHLHFGKQQTTFSQSGGSLAPPIGDILNC